PPPGATRYGPAKQLLVEQQLLRCRPVFLPVANSFGFGRPRRRGRYRHGPDRLQLECRGARRGGIPRLRLRGSVRQRYERLEAVKNGHAVSASQPPVVGLELLRGDAERWSATRAFCDEAHDGRRVPFKSVQPSSRPGASNSNHGSYAARTSSACAASTPE